MSDIVERLRNCANGLWDVHPLGDYGICDEAAETILALRKEVEALRLAASSSTASSVDVEEQPGDYLRDNLLNIAAICEAKHLLVEAASLRDTAAIVSDQLRKSSASLAASSHPASAMDTLQRLGQEYDAGHPEISPDLPPLSATPAQEGES